MTKYRSITDKPIRSAGENLLGVEVYAEALSNFILDAEAPLTIGMQGEWGTGKTSLMYMVRENLLKGNVATSWVNTWEYSLFKDAHETTPAVLRGLLENLIVSCKKDANWPQSAWQDNKDTITKGLKAIGAFAAKVAVNKTTGQSVEFNLEDSGSLISEVAELKNQIEKIARIIINSSTNPLQKIVFFVDDLDRIDPPVAVEILEALKNIFDIDNCIFILAIDYDIVIKGLESKFGKKTNANEREFRSFFDKIIQVPFSMPTGSYDIGNLLKNKFQGLGIDVEENQFQDYVEVVKLTVGYIPRSIKRYINSFSLLKSIRTESLEGEDNKLEDLCLFTLIGIQISYPHIFRLINRQSNFREWDKKFAKDIDIDELIELDKKDEELNETWEVVVWCFCQKDPYLKVHARQIIRTLNFLHDKLGDEFQEVMKNSMRFAAMTSVDDSIEVKRTLPSGPVKKDDEITAFFENVSGTLFDKLAIVDPHLIPEKKSRWAGVDSHMRYFNFWYKSGFWNNWALSYRVYYYNDVPENSDAIRDKFLLLLRFGYKDLRGLSADEAKIVNLDNYFKEVDLPDYNYESIKGIPSLKNFVKNDAFSKTTAEEVAGRLSELIIASKKRVDQILE